MEAVRETAAQVDINDTKAPTAEDGKQEFHFAARHLTISPVASILILALAIYLLVQLIRCCRKRVCGCLPVKGSQPLLVLKVFHGWRSITCPLMTLPYETNLINHSYAPRLNSLQPNICGGQMKLDFEGPLLLKVGEVDMPLDMPSVATVPLLDRWMMRRACTGPIKPATSVSIITSNNQLQLPYPCVVDMDHKGRLERKSAKWASFKTETETL